MKGGQQTRSDAGRIWQCRGRAICLAQTRIMGIINVTPDSFSDGGVHADPEQAIAHGLQLAAEGADLLDVGGESTRPGAEAVAPEEELRRVVPVVAALAAQTGLPVTIDTYHAEVARAALAAGACAVNDVMPFTDDPAMAAVVCESGAGVVMTHMRGTPRTMMSYTVYTDVVAEVGKALEQGLTRARAMGIGHERVVLDPGIGFAKTTVHNVALLAATARLARLGPLLIGASRKRFISELCSDGAAPSTRLGGSIAAAVWCTWQGAAIVRVHDVAATRQALTVTGALAATMGINNV